MVYTQPRTIARIPYSTSTVPITGNSNATHGAGLSTPWSGSFDIEDYPDVEIELSVPLAANPTGQQEFHVLIDSTCVYEDVLTPGQAAQGRRAHGKTLVTGLSAGSHTIAVQMKVASSTTGYVYAAASNPGLLTVREAE